MNQLKEQIEREAEIRYPHNYHSQKETFIHGANFALGLDRWVKIQEGCELPDDGDYVLLLSLENKMYVARYIGIDFLDEDDRVFVAITHWQPLPKLPK